MKFKSLHLKNLILVAIFALMNGSAWAYSFKVDGVYYNITDTENYYVEVTNNGNYGTYNTSVVIPATVTNPNDNQIYTVTAIGQDAFRGCTSLTSVNGTGTVNVTIPTSVTSIGTNAFLNCTGLTALTLPANLTSVGQSAFQGCSGLENIYFYAANCEFSVFNVWLGCTHACTVTIGDGVAGLPNNAFRSFTGLNSIVWGEHTAFTIGDDAFYGCTGLLTTLTIPDFVTSIGGSAFNGCTGITTLTIGTGVSSIGSHAFNGCSSLANVYFNATNCTVGGSGIFGNCTHDCTATIGDNVTSLPDYVFMSHKGLTTINWGTHTTLTIGKNSFSGCSGLTSIVIPDCVTSIGEKAFMSCGNVTTLTIGASVTAFGNSAFDGCSKLETVYYNAIHCTSLPNNTSSFTSMWNGCNLFSTVVIGNDVTHLPSNLFYGTKITTVNFDTDPHLQVIGSGAFHTCYYLTSFTIPNTVTTIGSDAFRSDNALQTITIGSGVTSIGSNAFMWCSGLETINWNVANAANNITIGDGIWYGTNTYPKTLVIGDDVVNLPNGIFSGFSGLTSLTIGTGVQTIADNAFANCTSLAEIYYNASNCTIGGNYSNQCWNGCTHDCTLHIGNNVSGLPLRAFSGLTGLKTIDFGSHETFTIGEAAFGGCTGLTSVVIPNYVPTIGKDAFAGCTGMTSLTIGTGVDYIGNRAFYNCAHLTTVNYNATHCTTITPDISYATWDGAGNGTNCTLTIGNNVTNLPEKAFYRFTGLTSFVFETGSPLTTISENAFYGCTSLASVTMPSSVTTISSSAFSGCTGLTSLDLGSVQTIHQNAFYGCTGLTTLTIPASVTLIDAHTEWQTHGAFRNCSNLEEIWFEGTTPPNFVAPAFGGVSQDIPVYVPRECGYPTAGAWAYFSNYIPYSRFTGTNSSSWDDQSNWAYGWPQYNETALIAAIVTVPGGHSAAVDHIVFKGTDSWLIIENAGQLTCNSITSTENSQVTLRDGGQLNCRTRTKATVERNIAAWTTSPTVGGWYFIASPTATAINPAEGYGLLSNEYDLYRYEEANKMWRNYKNTPFPLSNSYGYLYANSTSNTLAFGGTMLASNEQITIEDLSYACENTRMKGFNLMGNPFTHNLTSGSVTLGGDPLTTYYIVENGSEITAVQLSATPIKPGRGFLVQATAEGQALVFNPSAKGNTTKVGYISIAAGNEDFTDNAFIQIGGGNTLQKMTLGDNTPKVYVQQGNEDYAAVTISATENEMPIAFEAVEDGTYTIVFSLENVEMDYLHLIDNLTGADIDLLVEPSYTFEAKTNDYESRFRLVFVCGDANDDNDGDNDFAFFANGQLIIANEGQATLQVIDITGRILSSETINGSTSVSLKETAGVYMLRLVNGEKVKVQKVIIK